jgi:MFS superfamily sulfate permease-like transporter
MSSIARWIPPSVIRGIQLGLALLLARSSITYLAGDPALFVTGCIIVGVFLFIGMYRNIPDLSALCIIALGCAAGAIISGITAIRVLPLPHVIIPAWGDLSSALLPLVAPQALLTVTNAILATSFLTCDLFSQEVKPERLTRTIGLMNLTTVPLGGFPICHGAGGLVGHYRYGARTGAACLFAGGILCVAAILFGSREFLELIAVGLFGALLIFVAVELG